MFKPKTKKEPPKSTIEKKHDSIVFDMVLPFPVSNNALHKPTRQGGIVLSAIAREYYADMYEYLNKERDGFTTLTARLRVDLYLYEPDLRRRDINNLTKSLFDALQRCEVIADDHQIDETHIYRRECRARGSVHVIIRKLADNDERDNMKTILKAQATSNAQDARAEFLGTVLKDKTPEALKKDLNRWNRGTGKQKGA